MKDRPQAIASNHVVLPDGVRAAAVCIDHGRITAVLAPDDPRARGAMALSETWLLPGLVDTHVHVNDPGRADWEGFPSATRAALAGGVTTLVDMPLNAIPATNVIAALLTKIAAAQGRIHADVAFWGGVVPGNAAALEALAAGGVRGFKCFLSPSGVAEFHHVSRADLEIAAPVLARLGLPLLVHAEDPAALLEPAGDPRRYSTWLESRPAAAEVAACRKQAELALAHDLHVHIVHVASHEALAVITQARGIGARLTCETCPHYLCFTAEEIASGATEFKCAPPIRARAERESLWSALALGQIDLVASDHSPCPPALKQRESGDFLAAWGGIASLELGLSALWHEAHARGFALAALVHRLATAPAALAGLSGRKGAIVAGADADLVAFDPEPLWRVVPGRLHQRHPVTPYAGRTMRGAVISTWLRGERVWHEGEFAAPAGRVLAQAVE